MVEFNEEAHTYTNEQGKQYISATQLVGMFKQEFDAQKIAINYAKKNGETPEFWIEQWAIIKDTACEQGTAFHKAKEDYINGRGVVVFKKQIKYVQNQEFFPPEDMAPGLYTEMLLWNDAYGIAGQSDIVVLNYPAIVNKYGPRELIADLDDHKTNKRINKESFCHPRYGHKMMKFPLNHLMDCNLQHYELQLSIYAYILEMWGYRVGTLQITHYPHGQEDQPVVYQLEYRKKEVKLMLNFYRINNKVI